MTRINYKSDFKIEEKRSEGGVPDFTLPFRFTYYTGSKKYVASHHGGEYENCRLLENGNLSVIFDNHGLMPGDLRVEREYFLDDQDFFDGMRHLVNDEDTGILLTSGTSDLGEVVVEPVPADLAVLVGPQGPQGEPGPQGPQGEPGRVMTYDDMTEAQKKDLASRVPLPELPDNLATKDDVSEAIVEAITNTLNTEV